LVPLAKGALGCEIINFLLTGLAFLHLCIPFLWSTSL
jgi:hypothetical protein